MTNAIESVVRSTERKTAKGSSCCFVKLTESQGIKLYATKLERDASYVALSLAAEEGLAPDVGQCVEFTDLGLAYHERPSWWPESFEPKTLFGFIVERVEVGYQAGNLQDLQDALNELFGVDVKDIGSFNVGVTSAGDLVAIDLDGRFCGLLSPEDIAAVNKSWGGGFW